jgi:hypothetical protein
MKIVRSISLSEELWEAVEKARGRESRSGFVERMLEEALAPVPSSSMEEAVRLKAEDRARALEAQRDEIAQQPQPPKPSAVYACPEDRCPYMSTSPGSCVHHRTRKLVKA